MTYKNIEINEYNLFLVEDIEQRLDALLKKVGTLKNKNTQEQMSLEHIWELQNYLTDVKLFLTGIYNLTEEISLEEIDDAGIEAKKLPNGYRLVIPETPPKIGIFSKDQGFKEARNRWFSLVFQAVKKLNHVDPIEAPVIYVEYRLDKVFDLDHFSNKFIVDALVYSRLINGDDNINRLPIISEGRVCNNNQNTEIYIVQNNKNVKDLIVSP